VIGFDAQPELLAAARARGLRDAEFREADLRALSDPGGAVDGIWCSFAAAYFPELAPVLAAWAAHLRPGGWVALTEIDDLFGHEPLGVTARAHLAAYGRDALAAGRYDFLMGRKLRAHAERAGLSVVSEVAVPDLELAFDGSARPDVVEAWRARLDRMKLLQDFCGSSFLEVRDELLACLARADHRATARVIAVLATT
jgi:SAM-dependent methyltransferase